MEQHINELHLLLISLTGWEEDDRKRPGKKVFKSCKGYGYNVLDKLQERGYIQPHRNMEMVVLTDRGKWAAKKLKRKYIYIEPS